MSAHEQRRLKYAATINEEALGEDTPPDFKISYVDISNVDSLGRIHDAVDYNFEKAPSRARRVVRNGDVIISTVRTYLQAIAPIQDPPENLIVSTGFAVLRPRREQLEPRFCNYALREPQFLWEVITRSVGVSYPAINASDLGDIRIRLPSLETQRRIADYLDRETARIDALIAAKERLLTILAEKRRALITHAVTRGLNPAAPLRDSGLPWLGMIPNHWIVQRLKYLLCSIEQGWSPQCENRRADEDEWGVLKVGCVNGNDFDATENKALPADMQPEVRYEIKPDDILVSRGNTLEIVGSASLVREVRAKLLLCDLLYRLRVNERRALPVFVVHQLRAACGRFQIEVEANGTSNSMKKIAQETLQNFWLLVPPIQEQREIVDYIATHAARFDTIRQVTEDTIMFLRERRSALIAATVTGQLAVEW